MSLLTHPPHDGGSATPDMISGQIGSQVDPTSGLISFDQFDVEGAGITYDAGTKRFQPSQDGMYLISCVFVKTASNVQGQVLVGKSTDAPTTANNIGNSGLVGTLTGVHVWGGDMVIHTVIPVLAAEYLTFYLSSGTIKNAAADKANYFSIVRLGEFDGYPFLPYNHTWTGGDVQSNTADMSGSDSFITFPDDAVFDIADGDFTLEVILEWDAFPVALPHFFAKWGAGGDRSFSFWYRDDIDELVFSRTTDGTNISSISAAFTPTPSQVYHIAFCRNGVNLIIFVDGTQVGSGNVGTDDIFTSTSRLTIGNYDQFFEDVIGSAGALDGKIDYLKFSNVAKYTTNFTAPSVLINDADTVYLNTFTGVNGSTPLLNTES